MNIPAFVDSIENYQKQGSKEYYPVDNTHEKYWVNKYIPNMHSTSQAITIQ